MIHKNIRTVHQLDYIYGQLETLVDLMDERAVNEMSSGSEKDLKKLFSIMEEEAIKIYTSLPEPITSDRFFELSYFTQNLDESLKCLNYNYFKTTMLPDFQMGWHNVEWGQLCQLYPYLAILAARSEGKCFAPETEIVMFDGKIKQIKDIQIGDLVMGPDNTPRTIFSIHKGIDEMYEVEQKMFKNYIVNSKHDMYFKKWSHYYKDGNWRTLYSDESKAKEIIMEAKELDAQTEGYFHNIFGVGVNGWDLPEKDLLIEPYFLGYWLGDGDKSSTSIATIDNEIVDYVTDYCERLELKISHHPHSISYKIVSPDWIKKDKRFKGNTLLNWLEMYNLINNKHLPVDYLTASRKQRLELLAGLIDSDGHNPKDKKNSLSFTQKDEIFIKQVQKLCWSLGFRANFSQHTYKTNATKSGSATTCTLYLSGNLSQIPCKIERKKSINVFDESKSPQRRGLSIKKLGVGEYVGFTCDKDHLFILADGTIVKNSFEFSLAYPLWKMYGYRKPTDMNPINRQTELRREGCILTNEYKLGKRLLEKVVEEIKINPLLKERLKPDIRGEGELGKQRIETKNGCIIELRSADSSPRGLHPGWFIVDDLLDESSLYSQEQRDKIRNYFYSDIMKALEKRGGTIVVVGCVNPNSIVLTSDGLRRMSDLSPLGNTIREKQLIEYKNKIANRNGFDTSSHYWYNGLTKTKKIVLEYGIEIEGSYIHPLWKMYRNGIPNWSQIQELGVGDYVGLKIGGGFGDATLIDLRDFKNNINPRNKNTFIVPDEVNEELAYLIGLWIADGSFEKTGRITIVKRNKGIQNRVLNNRLGVKFEVSQEFKMRSQCKTLLNLFEFLGVPLTRAENKDIPTKIFQSNKETLVWFLRGLFDGDGNCYVDKNGSISVNLSSVSENLIRNVQQVLIQMGIVGSKMKRPPAISKLVKGKFDLHVLVINGWDAEIFIKEIGFPSSGKGDKVLPELMNREIGTNCCYIPYQKEIIKGIRFEKPRRSRGKVNRLLPFSSQEVVNKRMRLSTLQIVHDWFIKWGAKGECTEQLKRNIKDKIVYLPIKKIEESECYTVDFHIPDSHEFIANGVISHNTPFHDRDLYYSLRNDKQFKFFEYPAIFPDGTLTAPNRWSFEDLDKEYKSNGSIIFSRELLVVPVSDASTIFPWSILENAFRGMHNYTLVTNRDSFPVKFKYVTVGCDFAISANIGSDSSVFSVWGEDEYGCYWLLYIWKGQGKSHLEQIAKIKEIERNFRPDEIVAEKNGFQQIMLNIAYEHGVKAITPFTTDGWNKKDLKEGLPGLAILFEQSRIKLPRGDQYSIEQSDWLCGEFNTITIKPDSGKLESAGGHDDGPMSSFLGIKGSSMNKKKTNFEFSFA